MNRNQAYIPAALLGEVRLRPLLDKPFLATIRFQILVGLLFTLTAFLFRDRWHFLGDGGMWLSTFELFAANPDHGQVPWIDSPFTGQGLQYMPFSETLSAFFRFQFFRLAHLHRPTGRPPRGSPP